MMEMMKLSLMSSQL